MFKVALSTLEIKNDLQTFLTTRNTHATHHFTNLFSTAVVLA